MADLRVLALTGMTAVAAAASLNGSYSGQSDQGYQVTLRVASSKVTQFRFKLKEPCTGGSTAVRSHHLNPGVTIAIQDGQFDQTFRGKTSTAQYSVRYRIRLTGFLYRGRVAGTMKEREDYYRRGSGALAATCKSRTVSYAGDRS